MNPFVCRLAAAVPGAARLPITRAHERSCLRCQAVGARRRTLRKGLAGLGDEVVPAPPYLAAAVMARLGDQDSAGAHRRIATRLAARRAAVAGVSVAAAAAVITGLALRRSRTA
jgi:hypothetical protein